MMKTATLGLAFLSLVALPAASRADAPPAAPTAVPTPPPGAAGPYAALEALVGGTWSGALPAGADGTARSIDLHFAWAENKQGIRFASTIVKGARRVPYVSGMYAWNAAKKKLEMFYTDSGGSLTEGTVSQEGNALVHELTEANSDGTVDTVRVRLTKVDEDTFTNEIFILADGNFGKIAEVKYERQPPLDAAK